MDLHQKYQDIKQKKNIIDDMKAESETIMENYGELPEYSILSKVKIVQLQVKNVKLKPLDLVLVYIPSFK